MRLLAPITAIAALIMLGTAWSETSDSPLDALTRPLERSEWEAVGRIDIAEGGFCTGTLIAPDLVLTAGHCLVEASDNRPIDPARIIFRAGLSNGAAVAVRSVTQTVVHPDYTNRQSPRFDSVETDIALMRLDRPIPTTLADPFAIGEQDLGRQVSAVSYARGRAEALSWQRSCSVQHKNDVAAAFSCDVTFGASGSPVFDTSRRRPMIVSVISRGHAGPDGTLALGPLIKAPIAELIEALRTANGVNLAGGGLASVVQQSEGARFVKAGDGGTGGARFVKP